MDLRIRDYMTESPHSIGANQPLATPHEMMPAHQIRRLAVLRTGELVGIVFTKPLSYADLSARLMDLFLTEE